jgi:hypothetical protein
MNFDQILPLITFLLGSGLTFVTEALQYRRQVEREREARAAERETERVRQHAEFQTQTLLELQDALAQLLSLTQSQMMGEALSGEDRSKKINANLQAQALAVRVDDNELRARAQGVLDLMIELGEARDPEAASAVWNTIAMEFRATNDRVGELLRELY